ncbi:hypothetical protein Tco_0205435 [Tanacetum coccineum]
MECRVSWLWRNTFIGYAVTGTITINIGLIQAISTSLPPQPIGEATKAFNLQRIPPGVQGRSHFTYFLHLIVQITNPKIRISEVLVAETFHETDDELTNKEVKQMEADDQAIQIILMGFLKDIYVAIDSYEIAQEIWLRVQQMMKGSDIGIQDKKDKLFNEWERFTSTDGESIKSYYHRFLKLMNDFKRNKHFPEKIASNLKFLNNLQPEWRRHVTIVHQTKDLREVDDTQLYDFLKYNPAEITFMQQTQPNNSYIPQPSFNMNYMQQPMLNPEDISDPTTAMNMALVLMVKALKLNYSTPTNNNQRISSNPRNRQIAKPGIANPNANQIGNGNVVVARAKGNTNGNNEAGIQHQAEEFDFMAASGDLEEIEEVNANCILMANLQQASTSGTQTDKAPVYDSDGPAEVHESDNCYNNEIFNIFTQEEQYTELLKPISKPHQAQQNDSNVTFAVSNVEQSEGTVEQNPATVEDTRAYFESLYNNLAIEVEKVNSVNRKMKETNADLTTKLARYKNQEKRFEINQEKYDKLERCYQKSVYQEQCLTKKINALHLSFAKTIMTLNEEIAKI